jgi:hypothetical protein
MEITGHLDKMRVQPGESLTYQMVLDEHLVDLNQYLGKAITITWTGAIKCCHCGRSTNKSFNQGYCYPCFTKLAQCDSCMMSPEKCHFHLGTCREPQWAEKICFNDHIVYLANSSGIKVGITRMKNMPSRWLDQGASQALPIARVANRRLSGLIEDTLRKQVADKTSWQAMLKTEAPAVDLEATRDALREQFSAELAAIELDAGPGSVSWLGSETVRQFNYPVLQYPTKVVSHNLDKTPVVSGVLLGIKGQYLMLDTGVINLRKYTSYAVTFSA